MSAFSGSWADIDAAKQGGGLAHSDRGGWRISRPSPTGLSDKVKVSLFLSSPTGWSDKVSLTSLSPTGLSDAYM